MRDRSRVDEHATKAIVVGDGKREGKFQGSMKMIDIKNTLTVGCICGINCLILDLMISNTGTALRLLRAAIQISTSECRKGDTEYLYIIDFAAVFVIYNSRINRTVPSRYISLISV